MRSDHKIRLQVCTPKNNDAREKGFSDAGQTGSVAKLAMVRHCNANIAKISKFLVSSFTPC